jgi:hypothetical protein
MPKPKQIKIAKITTELGHVFYTREPDQLKESALKEVKQMEDVWMTEKEYNAIPATQESHVFFGSARKG